MNITFGHGSNPGPALDQSLTNYTYVANDCPSDGSYTITNQTYQCFSNSWHTLTSDHTGDGQGYFMLVNASYAPSDFFVQTISSLCPGTTYEFSAWIMNLLRSDNTIKPNITFSVEKPDGTILGSYQTDDIPVNFSPQWNQYGFYFKTPADASTIVLRMRNNAPGGNGNDIALDDITFRPCGPKVSVTVSGSTGSIIQLCEGAHSTIALNGEVSEGFEHPVYQWQLSTDNGNKWSDITGAGGLVYMAKPAKAGTYLYRLSVAESSFSSIADCRIASKEITVVVNPDPSINISSVAPLCETNTLTLNASVDYHTGSLQKTEWSFAGNGAVFPNTAIQPGGQPSTAIVTQVVGNVQITNNGKYYLFVQNSLGCGNIDSVTVKVNPNPKSEFGISGQACTEGLLTFTDKSVSTYPIQQRDWIFGDGQTASGSPVTHNFNDAKSYQCNLRIIDANGCRDSITKDVAVYPSPSPDFDLPGICISDPLASFINRSSISDASQASFTYSWNFGDPAANTNQNTSASKDPQHVYKAAGDYPVQLTVTSDHGCVKDTIKKFTVNGSDVQANFHFMNADVFCSADTVKLVNSSFVNSGNVIQIGIYWDYTNDPSVKTLVDSPGLGTAYSFHYPFSGQEKEQHLLRLVAYSGKSCVSEKDTLLTINRTPDIRFDAISAICQNDPSFVLTQAAETTGLSGAGTYSGAGVTGAGLFDPSKAGPGSHTIRYDYVSGEGCRAGESQTILVHQPPFVDAGPDKYLIRGGKITLQAKASGAGLTYHWSPPEYTDNPAMLTPKVFPPATQYFVLNVASSEGCSNKDSVLVTVLNGLYIPTAFTPNNDGLNDTWRLTIMEQYPKSRVYVFDRWGQKVYQSNGEEVIWDGTFNGKPLPAGIYVYLVDLKDGSPVYKGTITLIR